MILGPSHSLPNGTCRWPSAIPRATRQRWRHSPGFSAQWSPVPGKRHRIILLNHYLIIEVLSGALTAQYGQTSLQIQAPAALACSALEFRIETLEPCACRLHIFRELPLRDYILNDTTGFYRRPLTESTGEQPGIFAIGESVNQSHVPGMFSHVTHGDPGRKLVISHLIHPAVQKFCQFLASGPLSRELKDGLPPPDPNWIDPLDDGQRLIQASIDMKRRDFQDAT